MKKSTLLFIAHSPDFYGAEKVFFEIMTHLKDGYNIHAAVPGNGILRDKLTALDNVEVHAVKLPVFSKKPCDLINNAINIISFYLSLRRLFLLVKPDLIYCNTIRNFFTVIVARLFGIPAIWHIHERNESGLVGSALTFLVKHLPQKTIFVSRFIHKTFLKDTDPANDRQVTIYNGIAPSPDPDSTVSSRDFACYGSHFPVLALISQLAPGKRIGDAISAMALIVEKYPDAILLIAGDGFLKDALQQQIAHSGLHDSVHLLGYIHNTPALIKAADICLCPFEEDAFGLVAIEAMSSGKPVVAAASGGLLEIVSDGRTGSLYPVGDICSLAGQVTILADSAPLREEFGHNGLIRTLESFSLDNQMKTIRSLIDAQIIKTRLEQN